MGLLLNDGVVGDMTEAELDELLKGLAKRSEEKQKKKEAEEKLKKKKAK